MQDIMFSDHALDRMRQRRITRVTVIAAIRHPDITQDTMPLSRNRQLMVKYIKGGRLEVVIARDEQNITVVTAYYAS